MAFTGTDIAQIDIDAAVERVLPRVHRTPLLHSRLLDERVGSRVWLKAENFQRSGSFKARGAFNAALVGLEAGDQRGLLAISSGNHGQAVALAASELGLAATVVMAGKSSPVKKEAIRAYGAEVVSEGVTISNREEIAAELASRHDLRVIHPHDDPHVISGQATVGWDLAEDLKSRGVANPLVLVPLGGGGLLSGVALALKRFVPGAVVVGVEPEAGNDGLLSLASGKRVSLSAEPVTVADGAATIRLGSLCWEVIKREIAEIRTVSDRQLGEACWWLWSRCKLVVEPTGALAAAAAIGATESPGDRDTVCVLSGGNCLPAQIAALIGDGAQAG
ncbi:MAG: pyridoxal-phosphate dependent enzyme [Candidatus Dormiibacterota bacterium]